jgi:23S rRNA (adenine2503-C2)-methyltransferase
MQDLRQLSYNEIKKICENLDDKQFRTKQIYVWVSKGINSFHDMTDIPIDLREKLSKIAFIDNVKICSILKSKDKTIKFLNRFSDQNVVESVFMGYKYGNSICISTQVGCKMKCTFCASAVGGFIRNLTAGEMMGQIFEAQNTTGKRISNIVLMGGGEPLDNFDEVLKFIHLVNEKYGLNISQRNITLSTCGLIPEIYKLADRKLKITLAVSLHNPFQVEREMIIPVAKMYPIEKLVDAAFYYFKKTGRRVTFEYALIRGLNDSQRHAEKLGKLVKEKLAHINLIPLNAVKENNYFPSNRNKIKIFKHILTDIYHINTTIRRELGADINAACGQLRNQYLK